MRYDPARAAEFYDAYAEREWSRFEDGRTSPVSLEIHRRWLARFVRPGDRVLEAGAGPGRFTIELARLGARVVVADVSAVQLELNRAKVAEAGCEEAVLGRVQADVVELPFADGEFDATVCFGGPVSYALERAGDAVAELVRVTRPGGHVLVSVMSLVGSFAQNLGATLGLDRAANAEVIRTGHLPAELTGGHLEMRLFRWRELEELLARHGTVVAASASNLATRAEHDAWPELDEAGREALVEWELDLCAEPGAVESGPHILAAVRR